MPVRLGQFYAFVLLLACLVTNVAFFSEVREPFLGDVDPLASVKSAFSELSIKESIADLYTQVQPNVDGVAPSVPPKDDVPVPKERYRQPDSPPVKPESVVPAKDSVPPPAPEPKHTVRKEEPRHSPSVPTPAETLQTAAAMPASQPSAAKPVVADQFKPIVAEPKTKEPAKTQPSSSPVWDTVDTVLERPIRYD
jgi:hypothetical protein